MVKVEKAWKSCGGRGAGSSGGWVGAGRVGFGFDCEVDVDVDVKPGKYARFTFELGAKGHGLECG